MTTSIIKQTGSSITLQVTIPFTRSMLDSESTIQDAVNDVGRIATKELLKTFDSEGDYIKLGTVKMTSKGLINKAYQTPYGEVEVKRHVYQTSAGGSTFCPLEQEARIILTSTPRFASQVSYKMAEMAAPPARKDFLFNHNRNVSVELMQRLTEAVATIVQIKEETWSYCVPELDDEDITSISFGLDGTCMLMCGGSYRQAMVGTIALYDAEGERRHTTYIAAAPEYGKEQFKERLTREIQRTKTLYPTAIAIGVADGAHDNWDFLEKYTSKQTLDFYHAAEYLTSVADDVFSSPKERKKWLDDRCHQLKHTQGAAETILAEMKKFEENIARNQPIFWQPSPLPEIEGIFRLQIFQKEKEEPRLKRSKKAIEKQLKTLGCAITYFRNNIEKSRMNYAQSVAINHPIGSGITEAACKTIVKQRLCQSGMQWRNKGAGVILSLRTLVRSTGRWEQFWRKVDQFGLQLSA